PLPLGSSTTLGSFNVNIFSLALFLLAKVFSLPSHISPLHVSYKLSTFSYAVCFRSGLKV
ncbi:MAG: hypothetical protein DRO46_03560, partial [Candidatus Hecatellales archaeon]